MKPRYRRVLLKLSGEALGSAEHRLEPDILNSLAQTLIDLSREGVQIAVVVGGGNFWRGAEFPWLEASTSHQMGMVATLMNALALRATVESLGASSAVISALKMLDVVDGTTARQAIEALDQGKVVFLAGGTGHPFVTTDTGAVLWALKIGAEVVLKATKVDGIYSADPLTHEDAVRYERLSYSRAIRDQLKVMDLTAFSLCMEHGLPIIVFRLMPPSNIRRVVFGEGIGTLVEEDGHATTSA